MFCKRFGLERVAVHVMDRGLFVAVAAAGEMMMMMMMMPTLFCNSGDCSATGGGSKDKEAEYK